MAIRSPDDTSEASQDFERLERAVLDLAARYQAACTENGRLAASLTASERRVTELESELREANQRRRDVAKRVDDLIGQIDQIELRFAARGA